LFFSPPLSSIFLFHLNLSLVLLAPSLFPLPLSLAPNGLQTLLRQLAFRKVRSSPPSVVPLLLFSFDLTLFLRLIFLVSLSSYVCVSLGVLRYSLSSRHRHGQIGLLSLSISLFFLFSSYPCCLMCVVVLLPPSVQSPLGICFGMEGSLVLCGLVRSDLKTLASVERQLSWSLLFSSLPLLPLSLSPSTYCALLFFFSPSLVGVT
jgi:hypothetical protein